MTHYLVRWEIDIEADTPQEAAEKARACQTRPDTEATVFDVAEKSDDIYHVLVATIDLSYPEESKLYPPPKRADLRSTRALVPLADRNRRA